MNKIKLIMGLSLFSLVGSVFAVWTFISADGYSKNETPIEGEVGEDWEFLPSPAPRALLQGTTVRLIYNDLVYKIDDTYNDEKIDGVDTNFNRVHTDISSTTGDFGFFSEEEVEKVIIDDSFKDYEPTSMEAWFSALMALTEIEGIENINTSHVTSMNGLFYYCVALTQLNISSWDTSSLISAVDMFNTCASLGNTDFSSWNVSRLVNARAMFYYCDGMTEIDVSSWDFSSAINIEHMFSSCDYLVTLKLPTLVNSRIRTMNSILDGCIRLTNLVAGDWDVSTVANMDSVFRNCRSLTEIDLSSWDTSGATSCSSMFSGCLSLTTIYANPNLWNMNNVADSSGMFLNCTQIRGGNDTTYNASYVDKRRAYVDGYNGMVGYLTSKIN